MVKSVEESRRESKLSLCFKAHVRSIIQHELPPSDLYKLDPRYQDEGEKKTLEFDGEITYEVPNINSSLKEYKTLSSIIVPLSTYFSILIAHYNQFAGNAALLAVQMFPTSRKLLPKMDDIWLCHTIWRSSRGDYGGWERFTLTGKTETNKSLHKCIEIIPKYLHR